MVTPTPSLPTLLQNFIASEAAFAIAQMQFNQADAQYEQAMNQLMDYMIYNDIPSITINGFSYFIVGTRLQRLAVGATYPSPSLPPPTA